MAGQRYRAPEFAGVRTRARLSPLSPDSIAAARLARALALSAALVLASLPAPVLAGHSTLSLPNGVPGMSEPHTGSLLVSYFETFLSDQDVSRFRDLVSTRYTEGTLCRLAESGHTQARRAAVLALGLCGSYQANASVARGLRDGDRTVRQLAHDALWSIWFRADTPENNKVLEQVALLIDRQRLEDAIELSTKLIQRAPRFAEAYNKRATARFYLRQYEESLSDCRRVLELNPYHFGALSGMAMCQIKLGLKADALKTFQRALKLQPYDELLRNQVSALEAEPE